MSVLSPIPNLDYDLTTEPEMYDQRALGALRSPNASPMTVKIIPKPSQSAIIPDRRAQLLRRIGNAQAEIGRLNKLLDEIRADVLHLTTE